MVKFASVCSLAFVVILILGGCATPQGGFATQKGGRYDWANLEKYKKPSEKEVAKKPWSFDWLKPKPEKKKEVTEEARRYESPKPEEKKEVAKKPGLFDWLKRKPEKKKEATEEARRYEAPRPEEKKEVAEKPGRYDWLKTEPEEEKEVPEEPRRFDLFEAEPVEWEPLGEPGDLDLKLDYWMADGKQIWSAAHYGYRVSELEWWGPANFLVLTGEYRFLDRWSVDASYGTADFEGWDQTDTDWWPPIPFAPLVSKSHSDSEGDASFWMVDLYYRFLGGEKGYLDAFLGYQFNKNSFRDTNLVSIIPPSGPYPGLNSTYEIEYQAVRLGLRGETPLTSNPEWTLEGSVAYLPWVEAEGKGYWNLRDMKFTQSGGEGDGIDTYVAVNYRPHRCPNLTLELGYRYMELKTSGGISRSDEAGSIWYADWHKTKCRFDGIFFGLAYRF